MEDIIRDTVQEMKDADFQTAMKEGSKAANWLAERESRRSRELMQNI
jgi:hypothetical protein